MYHNALLRAQNSDVPDSLFASDVSSNSDVRWPVGPDAPQSQMPSLESDALSSQMPLRARCPSGPDLTD
ncbi:hypothetical protein Bca101_021094 [Brassica carinata]